MENSINMNKAVIAVDNENIRISAMAKFGNDARFSYRNFVRSCCGDYQIVAKHIATSADDSNSAFSRSMTKDGWEVSNFVKKTDCVTGKKTEKSVDVSIALKADRLLMEHKADVLVLLSGDADFLPLVDLAKENGVRVHVFAFEDSLSRKLSVAADVCQCIDGFADQLIYQSGSKAAGDSMRAAKTQDLLISNRHSWSTRTFGDNVPSEQQEGSYKRKKIEVKFENPLIKYAVAAVMAAVAVGIGFLRLR